MRMHLRRRTRLNDNIPETVRMCVHVHLHAKGHMCARLLAKVYSFTRARACSVNTAMRVITSVRASLAYLCACGAAPHSIGAAPAYALPLRLRNM
jgi:hypothetical protein